MVQEYCGHLERGFSSVPTSGDREGKTIIPCSGRRFQLPGHGLGLSQGMNLFPPEAACGSCWGHTARRQTHVMASQGLAPWAGKVGSPAGKKPPLWKCPESLGPVLLSPEGPDVEVTTPGPAAACALATPPFKVSA